MPDNVPNIPDIPTGLPKVGSLKKLALKGGAISLLGWLGLEMAPGVARGFKEEFGGIQEEEFSQFVGAERGVRGAERLRASRVNALNRQVRRNQAMLMQFAPHVAQKILAGMDLPEDATVIGGQPRTDLLEQVASRMGRGEFPRDEGF